MGSGGKENSLGFPLTSCLRLSLEAGSCHDRAGLHPGTSRRRHEGQRRRNHCRADQTLNYLHSLLPPQRWGESGSTGSHEPPWTTLLLLPSFPLPHPFPGLRRGSGLHSGQAQPFKKAISRSDVKGDALFIQALLQKAGLSLTRGSYRSTTNFFCLFMPFTKCPKTLLCHQLPLTTRPTQARGTQQDAAGPGGSATLIPPSRVCAGQPCLPPHGNHTLRLGFTPLEGIQSGPRGKATAQAGAPACD